MLFATVTQRLHRNAIITMAIGLSYIEEVEMLVFAQMEHAPDHVGGVVGGLDVSDTALMPKEMVNIEPEPPATQNSALRYTRPDALGA
jgi:hypothetical protein